MLGRRRRRAACAALLLGWCSATALALADVDAGFPELDAGASEPGVELDDCCTASGEPGCDAPQVLACVCEGDEFCCVDGYDELCVAQAQSRCGLDCDPRPPVGDCCGPSATPGCAEPAIADCVCAVDPFCCAFRFDDNCANLARALCAASCPEQTQ